jgi:hypothetical protein
MHPIDAHLKEDDVEGEVEEIELETTNIREIEVGTSITILDEEF